MTAFDPTFPEVAEKRNTAYLNHGVVITKYTGARGKSGTNDASAEFMHYVRDLLDRTGVIWQTGELGAVEHQGGGGTVAMFVAHMNVEVADVGVPVLVDARTVRAGFQDRRLYDLPGLCRNSSRRDPRQSLLEDTVY